MLNHIKQEDETILLEMASKITDDIISQYENQFFLIVDLPSGTMVVTGNIGTFFRELRDNPQAKIEELKAHQIAFK